MVLVDFEGVKKKGGTTMKQGYYVFSVVLRSI